MIMGNVFVFLVIWGSLPVIGDGNKTINKISNEPSENSISQQRSLTFKVIGITIFDKDKYPIWLLPIGTAKIHIEIGRGFPITPRGFSSPSQIKGETKWKT